MKGQIGSNGQQGPPGPNGEKGSKGEQGTVTTSFKGPFRIPSATRYNKRYYTVTCSGPCRGIGIKFQYSSGDGDLCANENSLPNENDSSDCGVCQSTSSTLLDECENIRTGS